MGKQKKKKRASSDALMIKKNKDETKKLNPFEVHLNKEKFKILGRKNKHDRGLPGVSRSKAIQKRKQTLGKEYQEINKVNKFKDRRIGGGGSSVPLVNDEHIANARFAAEKIAQFKTKKSDLFNLNDDEVLTHRGQTLEEIEQFQDLASDDSEDEQLDAEFTEAAHFGGDNDKIDRKALIEEKIIESKRRKLEILKEKEEVHEMTMKLDSSYKEVLSVIGKMKKNDDEQKPKPDDYDRILKEMIFEPRGEVTDKLQSEEEIARKEKLRLEELERQRLKRMQGEENETDEKPKHRSADDLDDGYFLETGVDEDDEGTLAYELEDKIEAKDESGQISDGNDNDSEENEDGSENDGADTENDDNNEEEEEEKESENENDSLDDLKEEESDVEEEKDQKVETKSKKNNENSFFETKENQINDDSLPFTYDIPSNYETLKELLYSKTPDNQKVIIERTLKCNHPKLDPSNSEKIVQLFSYLLKYFDDIFGNATETNIGNAFQIFNKLSPLMYDIVNLNSKASQCMLDLISHKYNEYKKNPKTFPNLNTIIFFKLISNLYSTSDFRHSIVTPCFIFISHILTSARPRTRHDLSIGLFIVTIYLEYTKLSKRILPAVFNYLLGILFLCIYKKPIEIFKILPPFSTMNSTRNILVVDDETATTIAKDTKEESMKFVDLVTNEIDDNFKIRILNGTLKLLKDCIENIQDNCGVQYYAEMFFKILEKLNITIYPDFVKENYEKCICTLNMAWNKPLKRLTAPEKKAKCLRLMEPRIEKVIDDKRRPKLSKEKQERAILLHKVKRETKGAIREIRRDTAFINKIKIQKQIQSDLERKEKVQRIYAEAAIQQGELNALSRKRKKL